WAALDQPSPGGVGAHQVQRAGLGAGWLGRSIEGIHDAFAPYVAAVRPGAPGPRQRQAMHGERLSLALGKLSRLVAELRQRVFDVRAICGTAQCKLLATNQALLEFMPQAAMLSPHGRSA